MPVCEVTEVPLAVWAHAHAMPWVQAWRALLAGDIRGVRKGARWYVIVDRETEAPSAKPAA